jgi:hypothetical protein
MIGCLTVDVPKRMETTVRQFVPMSDDFLDSREALPGPLVPYQCGLPCWHQLRTEQPVGDEHRELHAEMSEGEAVSA